MAVPARGRAGAGGGGRRGRAARPVEDVLRDLRTSLRIKDIRALEREWVAVALAREEEQAGAPEEPDVHRPVPVPVPAPAVSPWTWSPVLSRWGPWTTAPPGDIPITPPPAEAIIDS